MYDEKQKGDEIPKNEEKKVNKSEIKQPNQPKSPSKKENTRRKFRESQKSEILLAKPKKKNFYEILEEKRSELQEKYL